MCPPWEATLIRAVLPSALVKYPFTYLPSLVLNRTSLSTYFDSCWMGVG